MVVCPAAKHEIQSPGKTDSKEFIFRCECTALGCCLHELMHKAVWVVKKTTECLRTENLAKDFQLQMAHQTQLEHTVALTGESSSGDWTKTQWRQINVEQMDIELRRFAKVKFLVADGTTLTNILGFQLHKVEVQSTVYKAVKSWILKRVAVNIEMNVKDLKTQELVSYLSDQLRVYFQDARLCVEDLKSKLASQEAGLQLRNQDAEALIAKIRFQILKLSQEKTLADAEEQKVYKLVEALRPCRYGLIVVDCLRKMEVTLDRTCEEKLGQFGCPITVDICDTSLYSNQLESDYECHC